MTEHRSRDYLEDCLADWRQKARNVGAKGEIPVDQFQKLFCASCRNSACVHHFSGDPWIARMATQQERLTRPKQANPDLPRYAHIVGADFANMLQQAVKLEISARRNDWTVPEVPSFSITDGKPVSGRADEVDAAVKQLAKAKGVAEPQLPQRDEGAWQRAVSLAEKQGKAQIEEYVQAIYDRLMRNVDQQEEPVAEPEEPAQVIPPAPLHPKKPLERMPPKGNAPAQGGMLDGAAAKPQAAPDPWAVPVDPRKAGGRRVKSGARVKFKANGEIDEV